MLKYDQYNVQYKRKGSPALTKRERGKRNGVHGTQRKKSAEGGRNAREMEPRCSTGEHIYGWTLINGNGKTHFVPILALPVHSWVATTKTFFLLLRFFLFLVAKGVTTPIPDTMGPNTEQQKHGYSWAWHERVLYHRMNFFTVEKLQWIHWIFPLLFLSIREPTGQILEYK